MNGAAIWAVVPAAGIGSRLAADRPKQYLPLHGRPLLLHTLERLTSHPLVRGLVVGVAAGDRWWQSVAREVPNLAATADGGPQRAHTVLNALRALSARAAPQDWVLVHDAVRPCLRRDDIDRLLRAVEGHPDGGLLALPLADTVKRDDGEGRVLETVARRGLWRALTPQAFPLARLSAALERALAAGEEITDEAMAIEHDGGRPRLVPGHADNIKVTVPQDLALAELYLRRQQEECA